MSVGLSTSLFVHTLNWVLVKADAFPLHILLLPIGLALNGFLVERLRPDIRAYQTDSIIMYIHKFKKIEPFAVIKAFFLPILTIASGGSAGKEAPAASIGAGIGSFIADILHLDEIGRRKLAICGISAGFSAVFGTPVAGAIFGIEVLYVGNLMYDVFLPSFISGLIGFQFSSIFGKLAYTYFPVSHLLVFNRYFFAQIIAAGVFFGLCARLFVELHALSKKGAEKLKISMTLKGLIAGAALVILSLIFSTDYLGLGIESIEQTLFGGHIVWYAFLAKMLFTIITLGLGGSGGAVTPILFIGAAAGSFFASVFNADHSTFSAIGLVALLAGAANTPIAASIMAIELFGAKIAPYAALASIISFLLSGRHSVYPSQITLNKNNDGVFENTK